MSLVNSRHVIHHIVSVVVNLYEFFENKRALSRYVLIFKSVLIPRVLFNLAKDPL